MNRLLLLITGITLFFLGCKSDDVSHEKKIHGVSLVASKDSLAITEVKEIIKVHANYVSLMPFAFMKDINHPKIIYNQEKQWFGETSVGISQHKELLDSLHIQVMLKPQLWVWNGLFTGDIVMTNEADWIALEQQYENYILDFASLASQLNIAIFCIGTELHQFVVNRPDFFKRLIKKIRTIYHGKLTYAENWDVYQEVPFWNELDYIGIDAYFPLSENKTPSLTDLKSGWEVHKEAMKNFAAKKRKQVVFTEYGYRSIDFSGKEPWKHDRSKLLANYEAQTNCLLSLYQNIWDEPWFAGGFLWKWFPQGGNHISEQNRFTIQEKPSQTVLERFFEQRNNEVMKK
ncbi:hypothetical protein JoomaDRAFT_0620 [Galbibacter orientalis DSM 19592]|uniref:Glycoside hydrolase n=1 Tax=Galbibacter orientalis DSM 19592 TaxID=926559 RepID=I3C216_9FLAO|nr:glycoside hydrolase [Galbibacter orientalis]EIJ37659.1 hypothetical protein JoomaDRAFT_0620 [Galbibacter orientalis DSM 19592]